MSRFRDIVRKSRRDLHREMSIPALYIVGDDEPVEVDVRLHRHIATFGDVEGLEAPRRREVAEKILFLIEQLPTSKPKRNAIVSVEPGEAYRVGDVEPADDEFIHAHVTPMSATDAAGLPVPEVRC